MDAALGWIGDLIRYLALLVPRLQLVRATERGVKFVRDHTVEIGPGLHVWWPVTTEIDIYPVVRQVMGLENQMIITKDGKTVVADGVLIYSISDLHKFLVENFDADKNLAEMAMWGLRKAIMDSTLEQIQSGRAAMEHKLTREAANALKGFGVEVEAMRLQSCVEGQVIIHAGRPVSSVTLGVEQV